MLIPFEVLKTQYNINPKTILHIGASHGEERNQYRDNGVEIVFWIEAIPEVFEKLVANIQGYEGHSAINACVHETHGLEIEFNVSSNDGQSSSIFELGTHKEVHPDVMYTHKIKVKTRRADEIINLIPDMVNLDIQGAELLALKSMSWIEEVKWIYCEVNKEELYKGCPLIEEIDEYLLSRGFQRIHTVWTDCGWGDALYKTTNTSLKKQVSQIDIIGNIKVDERC